MSAFDKAWALLKGQYMHPSVMGHFARGSMVREADDGQFMFDDIGDPASNSLTFQNDPRRTKFNHQKSIAEKAGFRNAAEMREARFRPRVREQASAIPQEQVEDFIQNRLVNPPVIPAEFHPNAYPGERALNPSMLDGPDELNLKRLIAARQLSPDVTPIEREAYSQYPRFGLSEPTDRQDLFRPNQ